MTFDDDCLKAKCDMFYTATGQSDCVNYTNKI